MEVVVEVAFYMFVWAVLGTATWAYGLNKGAKRAWRISVLWSVYLTATLAWFFRPLQSVLGFEPLTLPLVVRGLFTLISIITLLAIAAGEGGFVEDDEASLWRWRPWVVIGLGLMVIAAEIGLFRLLSLVRA
jgi:hypothetical protein